MWIDMFPIDEGIIPTPVNISQPKPIKLQLRVVIKNTKNVKLDDYDVITGKYKSDIYVKGWLGEQSEAFQRTDIHNRSSTGDGNFNFRFVFDFEYLVGEKKIVAKKPHLFKGVKEEKEDPILHLQVYDADYFKDDLLGHLDLNLLSVMPKAVKQQACKIIDTKSSKKLDLKFGNLFEVRKMEGWWPFSSFDGTELTVIMLQKKKKKKEHVCFEPACSLITKQIS